MNTKKKNREQLQYLRDEALQAYLNREDFQYDVNADALYQRYKDSYVALGKDAMEDTMGQAAALTGGYGSSYAQNVGQQAYNSYLKQLGDVVPELYQLAYDRYRDKGDQLYKAYQSWSELEQEAVKEEQWEREYELAIKKSQGQDGKSSSNGGTWLESNLGAGEIPKFDDPTVIIKYDNQNVSTGNIMTLQRVLGLPETGLWTVEDRYAAGGMKADVAWRAYQEGKLQNRNSRGLGDHGVSAGNVRAMERVLGLEDDGVWSAEDTKAASGMSKVKAWEAYQQGKLQNWR